ncbi:hypothetical protein JFT91_12460 [Pseudomonas sp. TH08]|uniref:hypothetical protein n=1 Tax=unclassified Pseudomonas TaxID=196821 RepID=UPI001913B5E3|nr:MULTISPECIES: hypothetical protein [unclassified Pseudomonas]MBK5527925.1 hypothetical protein [Pseudomonas sp. TH06]MBK5533406.1 hypothetical protein [Pseudomonas sp. TH08]
MNQSNRSAQQAGTLDESFADAGIFRLSLPSLGRESLLAGIKVDITSTRLYFSGQTRSGVTQRPYVLGRLTPDGELDTGFGKEGIASGFFAGSRESMARSITLTSDSKILLTGTVGMREPALARFSTDGVLDTGFGDKGYVILPLPKNVGEDAVVESVDGEQASSGNIVPLDDGKTLVVKTYVITHQADTRAFVYLLNNDGSLDTSFNQKGYVEVTYPGATPSDVKLRSGLIDQDGKIVVCGQLAPRSGLSTALFARFTREGKLDADFGKDGFVTVSLADSASLESIIQQPNNRLLGIGRTDKSEGLLISLEPDGTANIQFNRGQPLLTRLDNALTYWQNGVMQPDGKIVLIGKYQLPDNTTPAVVARLLSDGTFDSAFAGVGWVGTLVDGTTTFRDVALQTDGKIVVTGEHFSPDVQGLVLRFHASS